MHEVAHVILSNLSPQNSVDFFRDSTVSRITIGLEMESIPKVFQVRCTLTRHFNKHLALVEKCCLVLVVNKVTKVVLSKNFIAIVKVAFTVFNILEQHNGEENISFGLIEVDQSGEID